MDYTYSILDFIFSIVANLISSIIFIYLLLYLMRPRIKISPYICYTKLRLKEDRYYYIFKIVNRTRFDLYDVNINLVKKVPSIVNEGEKINNVLNDIKISVPKNNYFPKYSKKNGYGEHALLVRTDYNIKEDIIPKNITFILTVTAKHGLTSLTRVVSQKFNSIDNIKENKEFKFGRHLDVM